MTLLQEVLLAIQNPNHGKDWVKMQIERLEDDTWTDSVKD